MAFIPGLCEPQSHWPRVPPPTRPPSIRGRGGPSEQLPQSRRTRGEMDPIGVDPILGSDILPYLYNYDTPGTKIDFSRVHTAPHGVETPIPPADR